MATHDPGQPDRQEPAPRDANLRHPRESPDPPAPLDDRPYRTKRRRGRSNGGGILARSPRDRPSISSAEWGVRPEVGVVRLIRVPGISCTRSAHLKFEISNLRSGQSERYV